MPENQSIEYKSSWYDDYLKWICGFANAQSGTIFIGEDDVGNVAGVEDHKKLMDEIPNKIKNNMGITAEVNLLQEGDSHFIEVVEPSKFLKPANKRSSPTPNSQNVTAVSW